jgi:hypothetical protein
MEDSFEERWKDEAEDRVKAARAEREAWIEDKEDKPDIHGKSAATKYLSTVIPIVPIVPVWYYVLANTGVSSIG